MRTELNLGVCLSMFLWLWLSLPVYSAPIESLFTIENGSTFKAGTRK